jgi:hypothetical protein
MKQPDLSKLLRGQLKLVSVEKLLRMLTAFDQDVEITIKPHRKRGEAGRITFVPAASQRRGASNAHGASRLRGAP